MEISFTLTILEKIDFLDPTLYSSTLKNENIETTIYFAINIHFNGGLVVNFKPEKAISFGSNGIIYLYKSINANPIYFVAKYKFGYGSLADDIKIFKSLL